jgi:spermidine synthase
MAAGDEAAAAAAAGAEQPAAATPASRAGGGGGGGGGGVLAVLAPCLVALLAVALRFDIAVVQLGRSLGVLEAQEKWFGMHPQETTLYSGRSEYQSIVIVKWRGDITLYIDGFSQFSSREEFRYHEALVHPIMAAALQPAPAPPVPGDSPPAPPPAGAGLRVLLLGAGDGLAARELLRYGDRVGSIDLVDLDPHMTSLFEKGGPRAIPELVELTQASMTDERVTVHHMDAGKYVVDHAQRIRDSSSSGGRGSSSSIPYYDVVIIDLPDPMMGVLSDLYSVEFYREVLAIVEPQRGILVTQATGLLSTKDTFWCIESTLRQAVTSGSQSAEAAAGAGAGGGGGGGWVRPYKAYVPVSCQPAVSSQQPAASSQHRALDLCVPVLCCALSSLAFTFVSRRCCLCLCCTHGWIYGWVDGWMDLCYG